MKYIRFISAVLLLILSLVATNADLLHCNERMLPTVPEKPEIYLREDPAYKVKDFLRNLGCGFQKGANDFRYSVRDKTMEFNENVREDFIKIKDESKDLYERLTLLQKTMEWKDVQDCFKNLKDEAKDAYEALDVQELKKEWNEDVREGYKMFRQKADEYKANKQNGITCISV